MTEPQKDKDQEKGDEVLRRLLKTPPQPVRKEQPKSSRENKSPKTEQKGDD